MGKLIDATKTENRLEMLKELRDMLAKWLEQSHSGRDQASLSRQFMKVTAEIAEIEEKEGGKRTSLDDFRRQFKVAK